MAPCSECGKPFTRYYNMMRHKVNAHPELFIKKGRDMDEEENEEDEDKQSKDDQSEDDQSEDDQSEQGSEDDQSEQGSEESGDDEEDDEDDDAEASEDEDATTFDLWTYLKNIALNDSDIGEKIEEIKGKLDDGELTDEEVHKQAMCVVKPDILKHIYTHYVNFLKLWHFAKEDKSHKKVMKTKRKLMNEEDFDPAEAIEHAVKKRKYLIAKATHLLETDIENKLPAPNFESEDEDETTEN